MGYLNSNIYQNGIDNTFISSGKRYVIALTDGDMQSGIDITKIAAVSAIINGGSSAASPSLDNGHLTNVFSYANKTLTIKSISYNYTKDVLSEGADGEVGGQYNSGVSSMDATYFAVIDLGELASAGEVEITPFADAGEKIKIPTSTKILDGTVVITGQLSGSGVKIQPNNNFLFGAVSISFSETDGTN